MAALGGGECEVISQTRQEDQSNSVSGARSERATNAEQAINGACILLQPETEVVESQLLRYSVEREEKTMARKELTDKISIYVPQTKLKLRPVERLIKLGEKRDRSVNYLVGEAIQDALKGG